MNHIITKEQYLAAKESWKKSNTHTASELIIYNLLRGFAPDRGFSPLVKPNKITSCCGDKWHGYNKALRQAYSLLTTKDTTVEYWVKKTGSAPMAEHRRLGAIKDNEQNQKKFTETFGLLLDIELATLLLAGLGERK